MMGKVNSYRWICVVLVVLLFLPACLPVINAPHPVSTNYQPATLQQSVPIETESETPAGPVVLSTSVLITARNNGRTPVAPEIVSTPTADPLRLVFPTPGVPPVSSWRPPLYPTPWAPTPYDHFYFGRPIAADEINWPVETYRYGGVFFEDVVHTGIDIVASKGTPVLAAGSGKVIWAGYGIYRGGYDRSDPYGLSVVIRHDFGYQNQELYTLYGHLDQTDVVEGQYVSTGNKLGLVGETGQVTGPHLHFEVRVGENAFLATRNPELWVAPPQGWGVLTGQVQDTSGKSISAQLITVHDPASGRNWFARSYGPEAVVSDPYYKENLVIGDLPAGKYEIRTAYAGYNHTADVVIYPGRVSYFVFSGWGGFIIESPPAPGVEFIPQPASIP